MKKNLICFVSIMLLSSCSHIECGKDKTSLADVWFKYDEPINGYDVSMHCRQAFEGEPNYFSLVLYLQKDGRTEDYYFSELIALERIWKDDYDGKDTIILHNTHKDLNNPFLDCNNIVYFEDIDFDDEEELIVCMSPNTTGTSDILDCENFLVFDIVGNMIIPCDNSFTREIERGLCRTEYRVDKNEKTITLTGYSSAYEYVEKVFWFKDGQPHELDYSHFLNGKREEHHMILDAINKMQ